MDFTAVFCMNIKGISLHKVKARGKDSCHNCEVIHMDIEQSGSQVWEGV